MAERLSCDGLTMTRDEATELCVYHLRQAAALFELIPDDGNVALKQELDRQHHRENIETSLVPARAWADAILKAYEDMKDDD